MINFPNFKSIPGTKIPAIIIAGIFIILTGCTVTNVKKEPLQPEKKVEKKIEKKELKPISGNSYFDFIMSGLAQTENRMDKSLIYLIKAQKKDPDSLFLKKSLARRYIILKKTELAETLILETLKKSPEDTEALGLYGGLLALTDQPAEDIIKIYNKILIIDPESEKAAIALTFLYDKTGQRKKLIPVFEKAVKTSKKNYYLYLYLGETYLKENDFINAKKKLKRAIEIAPNKIEPKLALIQTLMNIKKRDNKTIISLYKDIIALRPDDPAPLVELSFFYNDIKEYEKSDKIFQPVSEEWNIEKQKISSLLFRYIKDNALKKASFLCNTLFRTTGDDTILMILADGYNSSGNRDKALKVYSSINKDSKFYSKSIAASAYILASERKFNLAINKLKKGLKDFSNDPLLLITLGNIYEELESYDQAYEIYLKGTETKSDRLWSFYYRLGVVSDKSGKKDETIGFMEKSLELNPDNPDTLNYLGYTYADKGIKLNEAKEMILKALSIKKNDGYITDSLGWVYYKLGDMENAIKWLEKAYEIVKDDPVILEHLGDVYRKTGNYIKAKEHYEKAIKLAPENRELKRKISEIK